MLAMATGAAVPFGMAHANGPSLSESPGFLYAAAGQVSTPVEQEPVDISAAELELSQESFVYSGSACEPEVTVTLDSVLLVRDVDYEVTYADNVSAGEATLLVSGKGQFGGACSRVFNINPRQISEASVEITPPQTYVGKAFTPKPLVIFNDTTLVLGSDYTLSYESNKDAGEAAVIVKGKGNYTGQKRSTFTIKRASLKGATVSKVADKTYTGKQIKPKPVVRLGSKKLKLGRDYTLSYEANKNAGKATVVVKGKGNYTGQKRSTFTIKRASLTGATVSKVAGKTYTGKQIKPKPVVRLGSRKLKLGRDYTLSYKKNTDVGTATAIVVGSGNYKGKQTLKFVIKRASLAKATVGAIAERAYTGRYFKPKPAVRMGSKKLKLGRDYTLSYKRNRDVGQAQVVVRGMGNYRGKTIATFNIVDWVSRLDIAKQRTQLIVVEARGTRATVSMHVKVNGAWQEVVYTREGWIGYDGLGDAREGVAYTPVGVMYPDMAFGICGDPGCKMGYTQVDWSHYWCGDSYSDLYNQFVSTNDRSDFNLYESEHLISMGYAYNYCLNMGWNAECTPYGGAAFFLHCSTGSATAGCVSVPEWAMIDILCTIEPGCAIIIDTPEGVLRY